MSSTMTQKRKIPKTGTRASKLAPSIAESLEQNPTPNLGGKEESRPNEPTT